ncbi:hypothetical protein [Parvularcula maris]|nr:hypothetical protein [Parvularcula maris]
MARLKRGELDPNHNILRAASYARWNASLHLLQAHWDECIEWARAQDRYGVVNTGRWEEGLAVRKQLNRRMSRVHDKDMAEAMGLGDGQYKEVQTAMRDLLAAEKSEKADPREALTIAALDELSSWAGWDQVPPPLKRAFKAETNGFADAFRASIGELQATNEARWKAFQKIHAALTREEILANTEHGVEQNEKILAELGELRSVLEGKINELQANEQLVNTFLARILDRHVPKTLWADEFDSIVARWRSASHELVAPRNQAAEFEQERRRAKEALDGGQLEEAENILATLRAERRARREEEKAQQLFEQQQREARWREEQQADAELLKEQAEIVAVTEPMRGAALLEEAARELPDAPSELWADWLEQSGDLAGREGEIYAVPGALEKKVDLLSEVAGWRGAGSEWARLKNKLGNALLVIGERGHNDSLVRAVKAYDEALLERTRERTPLDWATIKNNLGSVLSIMAARGNDDALPRAIKAFGEVLLERTRDRDPFNWAATKSNLGNSLSILGERGDSDALCQAIEAYEDALVVWTRDEAPLRWATAKHNMGSVFRVLGERGDENALQRAVRAYEEVLLERTRDKVPLQWAKTKSNLGNALRFIGERGDNEALRASLVCHDEALEELTAERAQALHDMATRNRAKTLALIKERGL